MAGRSTPPLHDIEGLGKELQYRLACHSPILQITENKDGRYTVVKKQRRKCRQKSFTFPSKNQLNRSCKC